jgi:tetratricopeptide (TPR) repeat protein
MKSNLFYLAVSVLIAGFLTLGFQCGSPDFTGAKVQEQNKNYVEAAKLYVKEVSKNPSNHEAWFRLGRLRGEQLGDYSGMMEAFREAEKLTPTYSTEIHGWRYKFWAQHINNGVSFMKRASTDSVQYYDSAIQEYNTSVTIWPDTAITYLYLAAAYKGKGDFDNLIVSQKKAWNLGHDNEPYKQIHGLEGSGKEGTIQVGKCR